MKKCQNHKCYSTRYSTIESLLDVNVREYFSSQLHVISSALYDSRVVTIQSLTSTRHLTVVETIDDSRNINKLIAKSFDATTHDILFLTIFFVCYTTNIKNHILLDEKLQIDNVFQIVDFSHVIDSRWIASNIICSNWNRKFYKILNRFIVYNVDLNKESLSNRDIALVYDEVVNKFII